MSYFVNREQLFRKLKYIPTEPQRPMFEDDSRFKVFDSGRRWGKSLSAGKFILTYKKGLLIPNTRGWVVSLSYDLTNKIMREVYKDVVMTLGQKPTVNQQGGPIVLKFPWSATIEGKSAEIPTSLIGEGLDYLVFDEAAKSKQKIWEMYLRPTLTDREGAALFISTPCGWNWFYDLYKRGQDPSFPEWQSYKSPSWENPHLSKADIEEARRTMSEETFAQEFGAEFTIHTGQVYKEFDPEVHIVPEYKINLYGCTFYRSVDFGYDHPFACIYIAVTPDDKVIIFDEYYVQYKTNEWIAQELNRQEAEYKKQKITFDYTVADPYGMGASARATFNENGIPTIYRTRPVEEGIEAVRSLLRNKNGVVNLCVSSKCLNMINEFNLYSYPESSIREAPIKANDHMCDCLKNWVLVWRTSAILQYTGTYS